VNENIFCNRNLQKLLSEMFKNICLINNSIHHITEDFVKLENRWPYH